MKESSAELLHEFLKAEAAAAMRDGKWYSLSVDFQFSHNGEASQYKSLEVRPVGLPSSVDKAKDRFGVQIERDWPDFVSTALANNRPAAKASADKSADKVEKKYWVLKPDDEIFYYVFCKSEIASLSHDIIFRSTSKDDAEKICELLNRDHEAKRAPKQLEVKAGDLGAEGVNKFAELIRAAVKSSVAEIRDDLIAQMKAPPWMKAEVDAQEISPDMPGKTGPRVGLGDDDAFVEIDGVKYSADFAKAYGMHPPADEVPDREEASAPASGAKTKITHEEACFSVDNSPDCVTDLPFDPIIFDEKRAAKEALIARLHDQIEIEHVIEETLRKNNCSLPADQGHRNLALNLAIIDLQSEIFRDKQGETS